MKKKAIMLIGVVVVIALIGGGYGIFHKSAKPVVTNNTAAKSNSGTTLNNSVLITKTNSSLGSYLAEPNGATLYTYNGDSSGVSNVSGSLLASWPAYQDKGSTTGLPTGVGTIKRTDNSETQYTYEGLPLYTFVADTNGQVTGNGISNFAVAKPTTTSSSQAPSAPSTNPY